jgi:iron complex outermembrane receptor protein
MRCLITRGLFFTGIIIFCFSNLFAQSDTSKILNEVIVTGYNSNRSINLVPASLAVIDLASLNRFSNTSFLSAVNTTPGVRMEERSPGSYRFSIRGSVLRSPFGVRNVKFYWNGLPLTDGGGNTYLNLIDPESITSMEIIKGPGASLYGAGTGGVVLLKSSPEQSSKRFDFSALKGSYGLFKIQGGGNIVATDKSRLSIRGLMQQSDGYRKQTQMKRYSGVVDWKQVVGDRGILSTSIFHSNLFYETPGGLTEAQFKDDPTQARPATNTLPGAVEQKASGKNATTYFSSSYNQDWNETHQTFIGVYGSTTSFKNPAIRNMELRDEINIGGRAEHQLTFTIEDVKTRLDIGAEFQYFNSPVRVYENLAGERGALQFKDRINSTMGFAFTQLEFELPSDFYLTAGASYNLVQYNFTRTNESPQVNQQRKFDPAVYPRLALLKKVGENFSFFGSLSSGFSPPSVAEIRPSTNTFNESLNPEEGLSMEIGMRGKAFNRLTFDVVGYDFNLQNTIVIRRDEFGAEYFVNAGEAKQKGMEAKLVYSFENKSDEPKLWISYTYNDFVFKNYIQDGVTYSGNPVTGIAPHILVIGLDIAMPSGLYQKTTVTFTDSMPLNDANTARASSYWLMGSRLGYKRQLQKLQCDLFLYVDNLFDVAYSLGHDLNALGGRYYNPAPGINYSAGLRIVL